MRGRVFDAVAFITRRYGTAETALENQASLRDELADAGYGEDEIERAISWLRRLRAAGTAGWAPMTLPAESFRAPSPEEAQKLTAEARGLLFRLEQAGVLDQALREAVYERALSLDVGEVGLPEVRVLVSLLLQASGRGLEGVAAGVLDDDLDQRYH
ncbi:MAG: DUF494 domain-containing protein [Deltaproteobacteria bacterium]|nr:DUF494 domain-containing protein [Deltaproteobacteria bacterium]